MKTLRIALILLLLPVSILAQKNQTHFLFRDPDLPLEQRVDDLVSHMTLEEKISQLVYQAPAIDRLGIPAYNWWNEALHGVARAGYATVFPQSITVAGSWDKDLMYREATAISTEARAKYNEWIRRGKHGIYEGLTFWSPNINIFRDPRWGRGHETYGEDPYLTGMLGMEFVEGMQGNDPHYLKTVATAKHFAVHSGPEPLRHKLDTDVSDRNLYETYLPAFRKLVVEGKAYSVMGAYNLFRGLPCCGNPFLLQNILRDDWGFDGYVVSDCWAISDFFQFQNTAKDAAEAAAIAIKAGTDLNCGVSFSRLDTAIQRGLVTEADIDKAVKRLFRARFKLGMFDPADRVPYSKIPYSANCSDVNDQLAREAAQKSIILLKNENQTLPLSKKLKTIAVIGPNASNWEALIGNYNGIPKHPVTVLKGIENKLEPQVNVTYAQGSDLADGIHDLTPVPSIYLQTEDGHQGITGEYFANAELKGKPEFTRVDDQINFYWGSHSPSPQLPDDNFSVRWTGYIVPPVTGTYHLGCWGMPTLDVYFEGKKILSHNSEHHAFYHESDVQMEAGKRYKVVYDYKNWYGDGDAKLVWAMPNPNMLKDAVATAEKADAVVLVLGLSQRLEGEEMPIKVDGFKGGDRTNLLLPKPQRDLMKAIQATGKPVVLVLLNGSALAINWAADNLDAIVSAGYAGQEGGNAVADVLFGDYNPAGRLPVTYYKSVDQLPPFVDYDMKGRTYRYFTGEPLYPFGYGLSYTTFGYSDLQVPKTVTSGDSIPVSVKVTNTGSRDGDEVVELYITDEKASTPRPIRQLEGFDRIFLKAGESKVVNFKLGPRELSMINKQDNLVVEPGWFTISVGGKQPGFTRRADAATTSVVTGRFNVTGKLFELKK